MNNQPNNIENGVNNAPGELNSINLGNIAPQVPVMPETPTPVPAAPTPMPEAVNENAYQATANNVIPPVVNETPIVSAPMPNAVPQMNAEPVAAPINNVMPEVNANSFVNNPGVQNVSPVNNVASTFAPTSDSLLDPAPQIILPENESVGAIPPNKTEKKGMNKVLFVILILVLILGVAYGIYYFLNMNADNSIVTMKNLEYNINDELSSELTDYATFENISTANCSLNTSSVDTSVSGSYGYTITCEDKTYTANIEIIDNRDFIVTTNDLVLFKNSEVLVEDFVVEATKEEITYEFVDEDELLTNLESTGGPYEINILATDNLGNELVISAEYYVIYAYYDASSDEYDSENFDTTYNITDRFYIGDSTNYMGISYRTYTYTFDEESYTSVKAEYENATEFDSLVGYLEFDDETFTVNVVVTLTSETLDIEYGSSFPEDYASINSYYKDKGYSVNITLK